jgi:hypothetical protein
VKEIGTLIFIYVIVMQDITNTPSPIYAELGSQEREYTTSGCGFSRSNSIQEETIEDKEAS